MIALISVAASAHLQILRHQAEPLHSEAQLRLKNMELVWKITSAPQRPGLLTISGRFEAPCLSAFRSLEALAHTFGYRKPLHIPVGWEGVCQKTDAALALPLLRTFLGLNAIDVKRWENRTAPEEALLALHFQGEGARLGKVSFLLHRQMARVEWNYSFQQSDVQQERLKVLLSTNPEHRNFKAQMQKVILQVLESSSVDSKVSSLGPQSDGIEVQ